MQATPSLPDPPVMPVPPQLLPGRGVALKTTDSVATAAPLRTMVSINWRRVADVPEQGPEKQGVSSAATFSFFCSVCSC